MAIDVEIQDERGGTIARYDGPLLGLNFLRLAPVDSACFRFIQAWSDATFNEEQIEVLKIEIGDALAKTSESERQRELKALLKFLGRANGTHVYVKFIGD